MEPPGKLGQTVPNVGLSIQVTSPPTSLSPTVGHDAYYLGAETPRPSTERLGDLQSDSLLAELNGASRSEEYSIPSLPVVEKHFEHEQDYEHEPMRKLETLSGIIENFQLAWFAMTMGWGGTALVIAAFPGARGDFHKALQWIGVVIWIWNMIYWGLFMIINLIRCCKYPGIVRKMLDHPTQFTFFGCIPMGFVTVSLGFLAFGELVGIPKQARVDLVYVFFWIDVVMSLASAYVVAYYMVFRQAHSFKNMSAVWMLPFVANVVASALGATLSFELDPVRSWQVVTTSFVLWGMGVSIAMTVMVIYFAHLVIYGPPSKAMGNSSWIILGPIGQGGNAILQLGRQSGILASTTTVLCPTLTGMNAAENFMVHSNPKCSFGLVAPGATMLIGYIMWGFGMWWLLLCAMQSLNNSRKFFLLMGHHRPLNDGHKEGMKPTDPDFEGLPFNLGWWGIIFPLITQTFATYQLFIDTDLAFFKWMGRILCVCIVCISFLTQYKTIVHSFTHEFWLSFHPPAPPAKKPKITPVRQPKENVKEALLLVQYNIKHPFGPKPKRFLSEGHTSGEVTPDLMV